MRANIYLGSIKDMIGVCSGERVGLLDIRIPIHSGSIQSTNLIPSSMARSLPGLPKKFHQGVGRLKMT